MGVDGPIGAGRNTVVARDGDGRKAGALRLRSGQASSRTRRSDAEDGAGIVDVDGGGAGNFGETRHEHHIAGDDDNETGTSGE